MNLIIRMPLLIATMFSSYFVDFCFPDFSENASSSLSISDTIKNRNYPFEYITNTLGNENRLIQQSVVLQDLTKNHLPDLTILDGVKYTINKDNRFNYSSVVEETRKVGFTVEPNAYLKLEEYSNIDFDNMTYLHIKKNGTLMVSDGALLKFNNGSFLQLDSGARMFVRGTGQILFENSSSLNVNIYTYIILQNKTSLIKLNNNSSVNTFNDYMLEYTGEGKVLVDSIDYYKLYRNY